MECAFLNCGNPGIFAQTALLDHVSNKNDLPYDCLRPIMGNDEKETYKSKIMPLIESILNEMS